MVNVSFRKALAATAALTLAVGGALLTASAANAAPGTVLAVDPGYDATPQTYSIELTGVAPESNAIEDTVDLFSGATALHATVTYDTAAGTYDLIYTFASPAVARNLTVQDTTLGNPQPAVAVSITLPTPTVVVAQPGANIPAAPQTITGTTPFGSTVVLSDDNHSTFTTPVISGGSATTESTWTSTVDFSGEPNGTENVYERSDLTDGSVTPQIVTPITLVGTPASLVVDFPTAGEVLHTRDVVFSGTGEVGATVNIALTGEPGTIDSAVVGTDGTWTTDYIFNVAYGTNVSVDLQEAVSGANVHSPITRAVTLPARYETVQTPSFTSPTANESFSGGTVTFAGTGLPGNHVGILVIPTAAFRSLAAGDIAGAKAAAAASGVTIGNTGAVIVGTDGTYSVTTTVSPAGSYTAVAFAELFNADGTPATAEDGVNPFVSTLSDPVTFTVAAGTTTTGSLAFTGSSSTPYAVTGLLLLLAGTALLVMARVRRRPRQG